MDSTAASGPRAGVREWLGLTILALPTLLLSLDFSVTYLAVPHLSTDLGATGPQQLWIADVYGFLVAGFLIPMGTLGDRIGRRKLLLIGAAVFCLASVAAAFSTSPEMLIAARAAMGIGGATLMPSTLALISNMFKDPKQMGTAIAIWMSCFMGGMALGPVVGGVLLGSFWWGSVFLIGVPVLVLLLVTGPILLPEYRDPGAGRVDLLSVLLSLVAVLPIVYGFKELAKSGFALVPTLVLLAGLVLAVVFVLHQRRLSHPMVDMRLFGNRTFTTVMVITLVGAILQAGTYFLVVQSVQGVDGLSPMRAGLLLAPVSLVMVVGINVGAALAKRIRPGNLFAIGFLLAAAGYLLITTVDGPGHLVELWVGYAIMAVGTGLPSGLGTGLLLGSAPPEKAGSVSSLSEVSGEFGMSMGVAVLGSVGTVAYHSQLSATLPAGLPPDVTATAMDNIALAESAAQRVPGELGAQLLDAARIAFTSGLRIVAVIGAVLFVVLAAYAATALRHLPPTGAEPDDLGEAPEEAGAAKADHHA
ncbi:MFS transporter [Lentzea sp. PSKA42]|uniref:MFS transporter n=1 Tax=Lentzea indica TaxID=2604800 RepID=A0ABX1FRJ5_9PSEU|nr:MFS transporter [Lentzea indica]NKE61638.1 MFS transporter [Lentzea indica]